MMKKRIILAFAIVTLLVVQCLVPCVSLAAETKELEIIYQYSNDKNKQGFESVIAKFEELNPDVKVNKQAIPLSEFSTVLQTRVASNDLPDVAIATPRYCSGSGCTWRSGGYHPLCGR